MKHKQKFDIIVIGAGSGGLVAAEYAAHLGASVLIVEKEKKLGGDCLNFGCVPSKALLHGANSGLSFKKAIEQVHEAMKAIEDRSDNDAYLESKGITVVHGAAVFSGPRKVNVGETRYDFKKCIIATGSTARTLPDQPSHVLTNEQFFKSRKQPKHLLIMGAGPIGLEMATALAQLGSKVTVIERGATILQFMSSDVQQFVLKNLHPNITVLTAAEVESIGKTEVRVKVDGKIKRLRPDEVLSAIGRVPVYPRGMEIAGVAIHQRGITVDSHFRTTNKHIYAVGDVALRFKFTHTAAESAGIALSHALFGVNGRKNTIANTPFAIFAQPEIAAAGKYGSALADIDKDYVTYRHDYSEIDKAVTSRQDGFMLLHATKKGVILGAEMVGANASELIGYVSFAMANKLSVTAFSKTIFPYPTMSLGLKQLAGKASLQRLDSVKGPLDIVRRLRM